ncbi:MAG: hypothetical protein H0T17_01235 [Propionibacteriales bacterium]|nr:hypothetical protein [Propionibacteriales bacterium]
MEFYRQQVILPAAVVARRDWLLGVVAVHNTQVLLYQLLTACDESLPQMGVKRWSTRLAAHPRWGQAGNQQHRLARHRLAKHEPSGV